MTGETEIEELQGEPEKVPDEAGTPRENLDISGPPSEVVDDTAAAAGSAAANSAECARWPGCHSAEYGQTTTSLLGRTWATFLKGPKATWVNPDKPPEFTLGLNLLFTIATTVTVANLYYNQPILNLIAETFDVSFERASSVATLMQAGYAVGLLLICPLGDVFERRPFILGLVGLTAVLWLGLCLTNSFQAFQAISFICGFTTVTPQLMLPLVGDLAPPHLRSSALSIIVAGLSLGMMVARVLSGIISNFTDWRNIYWVSFGMQGALLAALYMRMPDYPSKNPKGLNYLRVIWSIFTIFASQPVLIQACLVYFCMNAVFTSYWTTLSFLLSSQPYTFRPLEVGLFGLISLFVIFWGPPFGRLVLDRLTPLVPALGGVVLNLVGITVGTFTGTFAIAGPVLQAVLNDVSSQATNVSLRAAILAIAPNARNRVNTAYMLAAFCGQMTGTAVGNRLYAHGGWIYSGSCSMGFMGFAILVCLARGPREKGWVGWTGGWHPRRDDIPATTAQAHQDLEHRPSSGSLPQPHYTTPETTKNDGKASTK